MSWLTIIWLIALSISVFLVYRKSEEGRSLWWRLDEMRRDLDTAKRDLAELRKKLDRASLAA